jgi:ketosteroid isomerase-like protein
MPTSRRSAITTAGAALAAFDMAQAASPGQKTQKPEQLVAALVQRSEQGNDALMRGDIDRYRALLPLAADFTLMSPFGSHSVPGKRYTEEEFQAIGRFFKNGTLKQEVVQTYHSPDMIVLAVIEHTHVEVGGLPAQDWSLRVTLVFRREGTQWLLAHRHADPLAQSISLEQSAALAGKKKT